MTRLAQELRPVFRQTNPHEKFQDWVSEAFAAVRNQAGFQDVSPQDVMRAAGEVWNELGNPEGDVDLGGRGPSVNRFLGLGR